MSKQIIIRCMACTSIIFLIFWFISDQLNRYMGSPGGVTFDISVPNAVAIPTFCVSLFIATLFLFIKGTRLFIFLSISFIICIGPLWFSTRHIYLNDKNVVIERGLFLRRSIDGGDPEARCFVERGNFMVAIGKDGRELGGLYKGIFPWNLNNSDFFDILSTGCRHQPPNSVLEAR